jgi:hypothetical protein
LKGKGMKKLLFTLTLATTAVYGETWTGVISDANCGAKHADASEASMKCVNHCLKGGAAPVFVADGKVIKIANPDSVKAVYGQKVSLTGKLDGDSVTVDSVTPADAK